MILGFRAVSFANKNIKESFEKPIRCGHAGWLQRRAGNRLTVTLESIRIRVPLGLAFLLDAIRVSVYLAVGFILEAIGVPLFLGVASPLAAI